MTKKDKSIKEVVDSLSISDEIKSTIFEYFLLIEESEYEAIKNIRLKIPYFIGNKYAANQIFNLSEKHDINYTIEIDPSFNKSTIIRSLSDFGKEEISLLKASVYTPKIVEGKEEKENELNTIIGKFDEILDRIDLLSNEINKVKKDNNELKEDIYNSSSAYKSDRKVQYIPIDIYLDTDDNSSIFEVYDSVLKFLESIEFIKAFEFEAQKGSWFKRMVAKSKKVMTSDEVNDRLKEAEYGVEVNAILKQQSEIDKNQSEALLNILKSIENVPNAAIRIGSLLVVKLTNDDGDVNVQVRSLSIQELHLLNKKPDLLHKPTQILNALTAAVNGNKDDKNSE